MADEPQPLGDADYRQLFDMLTSGDATIRDHGGALAKKLTPTEQQDFFAFQKAQHPQGDHGRVDNSVLGVPPEMAVVAGLSVGRAVAGAGAGMLTKGTAGAKAALSQAAPALKYEAVKSSLTAMGVPAPMATAAAYAVSAYGGRGKGATPEPVHVPTAEGFEAYGNPVSVSPSAGALSEGAGAIKAPAQGTFTQLADGTWGIKGDSLKAGDSVHVMNRAGNGQMLKIGEVLPDGTATIAVNGDKVALSAPDVLKVKHLIQQGVPQQMAVNTVLKLRKAVGVSP